MTTAHRTTATLALALLVVWFAAPLVPLALWAGAEVWSGTSRLPEVWGTDNLTGVFTTEGPGPMLRSLALGSAVAMIATPAGALAARALALGQLRRPRLLSVLLFAPVALPVFAVVMGLNVVLLRLRVPGWAGIVLVLTVAALPYTTFLMRAAYASYDLDFEDEARTLGASPRAVRWRVRTPLLLPALTGAAFLAFLVGWSDYIVTLLLGGGRYVTLPILVASAASGTGNEPTVAALSLAALVPPAVLLVLAALLRRRLTPVRGTVTRSRRSTRAVPSPTSEGAA